MPLPKKLPKISDNSLNDDNNRIPDLDDVYNSLPVLDSDTSELPSLDDNYTKSDKIVDALPSLDETSEEEKYIANESPFYEDSDKEEEDIDYEEKKIKPTGGKKSKRVKTKVKAGEFDNRKNLATTAKVVRSILALVVLYLLVIGTKNTYFPEQIYTPAEIDLIVRNSMGQTGFPLERGAQFVEDFTREFLTTSKDNANTVRLNRFFKGYNRTNQDSINLSNILSSGDSNQVVVNGPTVFEKETLTSYSAYYKVTAQVSDDNGQTVRQDNSSSVKVDTTHWISLVMSLYYDVNSDSLAVVPDTIALIPTYEVKDPGDIPQIAPVGNGEENSDMVSVLRPTIHGYIRAFANVSESYRDDIKQYIPSNANPSLYQGFNGTVALDGDPNSAINYQVYNTNNSNEWRIIAKVRWIDRLASSRTIVHNSTYIMTIKKESDSYLVTAFNPYYYFTE